MTHVASFNPASLDDSELAATAEWLAAQQKPSGEIPWYTGGKMDPWDHIHGAMALSAWGRREAALAAYRYMAKTQDPNGGWAAERRGGKVTRITQETNHAAYIASGVWHFHAGEPDAAFLEEMWPCVERATDLVVSLQLPSGAIAWAIKNGKPWLAPLVTGSSSIHGSLVCAIRIAERLGRERPAWREARARLARVVRHHPAVFQETDLPQKPGWHAMDWYYPVLGGAVNPGAGACFTTESRAPSSRRASAAAACATSPGTRSRRRANSCWRSTRAACTRGRERFWDGRAGCAPRPAHTGRARHIPPARSFPMVSAPRGRRPRS
jgi:hypothetical protein